MQKMLLAFVSALLFSVSVIALKPVDANDSVTFVIKNFGIGTRGELKGLKGIIKWDPANPSNSSFNVSVEANSVNTGIDMRDNDIKDEKYFDIKKYPTLNFVSTAVNATTVSGNLTIKGVTKPVNINYSAKPSGAGYLFEGNFSINRKDYGLGGSSMVLGNNVDVTLKVHANP